MRLLLFSNSTNAGEDYLAYTLPYIKTFAGQKPVKAVFIPYAGITVSWDNYFKMVAEKLILCGIELTPIHWSKSHLREIEKTEMIIVGGGNTFHLLKTMQENNLMEKIRLKVFSGTPYIGWSAGSNLACPTIRTTNDMPVVEPLSFDALGLIPFQINPHYTDATLQNFAGEGRETRIKEFISVNQNITVAGLREGSLFEFSGNSLQLKGDKSCRIFKYEKEPLELAPGDDFSFLMV
ncbi:MAG: dipeptidase PepE [Bacteroidales bacterium]|nr:dipeptidase PepE [Bacteroidales bacterium]